MPEKANDKNFPVKIASSLGSDLLVESVRGEEQMGQLFVFYLELLSENPELHFDSVLGQQVTVSVSLGENDRYFNGYLTEFRYAGVRDQFYRYQAVMRPWFWFLTRTSDCRIFQGMTVPEIIKSVFADNGMADFKSLLKGTYIKWDYCVQYRESDFNFISRLMEQEGIYYFFEHQKEKHELVMTDEMSTHSVFPNFDTVTFHPDYDKSSNIYQDHLDYWSTTQSIMPSKYAMRDFNFKKTSPILNSLKHMGKTSHDMPPSVNAEIYDYPGEYEDKQIGMNYAKIRLEELQCQQERVQARGTCRGMSPGCKFTLEDFPRADQNVEHLVISVSHMINNAAFEVTSGKHLETYRCEIEVMRTKNPFRTARETPKPMVQGPQTAIVVGPANEEIFTDEYGRVKVQFHWDRYGEADENSSCWVRVSQLWAGKQWGAMHIPRIGHEVIVSFMEGDPDRPIITGRVYNEINKPPYALEGNKTQSGIKSRSTKEGGPDNFNEIRFEDKIGEEEVYIHAEKNQNNIVENDETTSVGHDRTEDVGNNEKINIGVNRTEDVGKDETISIGENRTEDVGKNETISIGENRQEDVGKNENIAIGENRTENVGKNETITIGNNQTESIGKNLELTVGDSRTTQVAKNDALDVGKDMTLVAGDQITLKTGNASIVMKKDGTITIKGKNIKVQGSGKIDVKASKTITMKGSKIMQN